MKILNIGLIAIMAILQACSGPSEKAGSDVDGQLSASLEAFENRTIHKRLTQDVVDNTADKDLVQIVFDNLSHKIPKDYMREYATVMTWNKSRQAIYMIWWLEAEVNNGGYNQYFYNSSNQFYKHLPSSLRRVGAKRFADLCIKANYVFEHEKERLVEKGGTVEEFENSYVDNSLNDLDTEFYSLYKEENLAQLQIDFIRKNKKDFIDE